MDHLKAKIRHVPDFPKKGILFYDITTLLADPSGFRDAVDALLRNLPPWAARLPLPGEMWVGGE